MTVREQSAFEYARGDGYQAVSLPYLGRELSMVVILPTDGTFTQFEQGLDGARVDGILRSLAADRRRAAPAPLPVHDGVQPERSVGRCRDAARRLA